MSLNLSGNYRRKVCPRCGRGFLCGHDLLDMRCDCRTVQLQSYHFEFLRRHYHDCLCLPCLREIANTSAEEILQMHR
ncbi:cysteine-rich CWC family protein [Porphyromonas gulae]|uniref:cysteine-rich CWC family protein n=1 Tax=Porphyromonas gulae TaxID=111105 RepID=UPI0009B922BA